MLYYSTQTYGWPYGHSEFDEDAYTKWILPDICSAMSKSTDTESKHMIPFKYRIKRVIFHDPATIVYWEHGKKTVVKASNEPYDPEKGLAMCIAKRTFGNEGNYYEEFKKWLPKNNNEEE